ncbi:hypothetical protein KL946_001653 [Ogataea haglerorum]|uniref:Uncharacterized protein n=1 Tax=Ogataea haglerorum TaxID=1937702 RepID=A0ABQ7RIL9_9ASCO|nr:hypothetical protein KL946_001653 [Ogataea haglerorum]
MGTTLLSLLDPKEPRRTKIESVDAVVDFTPGNLYDIACVPGTIAQWDILFGLLDHGTRSAIVSAHSHIPWHNFKGDKTNIDLFRVDSLTNLIFLVQNLDFSPYKLVILDDFHSLYQFALTNLRDRRRSETQRYKRDANGHRKDQQSPSRKLQLVIQSLLLLLSNECQKHDLIVITTGKMVNMSQRFFSKSRPASTQEEEEDTSILQQIMVPILPLNGPWSGQYAKRLVLYKDWVKDGNQAGLDKSLTIVDYIQLMEKNQMRVCPQFLCIASNNGERTLQSGWW